MKEDTKLVMAGRDPEQNFGIVNPPVYHASTILFPSLDALKDFRHKRVAYGRWGTPGTHAFEDAMIEIEGGEKCLITPSGLSAISTALLSYLKPGDHLLMVDNTYEPCRRFCNGFLASLNIETTYYDPLINDRIGQLIRPNTKVVYCESPGSLTFEMQDIPAIAKAAKDNGTSQTDIVVMMDNTWATPLYFKPLEHGVDISIQSITKYIGGYADLMLGTVVCREAHWPAVDETRKQLGLSVAPDDVYLAQRGLRSLSARLRQHGTNALKVAQWLEQRPEVKRLLYPALPSDPGHAIWQRDFSGAPGLFSFILHDASYPKIEALVTGNKYLGIGFSWGGYESLLIPCRVSGVRTATKWQEDGALFRIHVGLEDSDDIIADLDIAFDRYHKAAHA